MTIRQGLVLTGLLIMSFVACGCGSYDSDYKYTKVTALTASLSKTTIAAGETATISVSTTDENGKAVVPEYFYIQQSNRVGELDNKVFTAKYPGKSNLTVYTSNYTYSSSSVCSAESVDSRYYVQQTISIEVLPNDMINPPPPPTVALSIYSGDLRMDIYRDKNTEGFEISYGTDLQASNKGIISNKNTATNSYDWLDMSYYNTPDKHTEYFQYTYGPQCISKNETSYYKIRSINSYKTGDWSAVKILSESVDKKGAK